MKYIYTIVSLLIFSFISCNITKNTSKLQIDESGNLVGVAEKSDFLKEPFNMWFVEEYESYTPDNLIIKQIKPLINDVKVVAVMGTWCGDSRREVPRFYKVLDALDFNYKNLKLIAVDRSKNTPDDDTGQLNIERVPTLIFYKDGVEMNRFVEYPRKTLEKDILAILQNIGYKHVYED